MSDKPQVLSSGHVWMVTELLSVQRFPLGVTAEPHEAKRAQGRRLWSWAELGEEHQWLVQGVLPGGKLEGLHQE